MTLQEALAIAAGAEPAAQAKPKHQHRQPLDKLQETGAADQFASSVSALSKRFDGLEETASSLQKRIDQVAADVEYLENFTPGSPPRRPLQ
jgi:hypothetical protein